MEINEKMIQRRLMIGIPFYGYNVNFKEKSRNPIVNHEFIKLLKEEKGISVQWDSQTKECIYQVRGSSKLMDVYYPCLKFLKERLQLLDEYKIGAFVWEGGQGLDYFYEYL